MKLRHDLSTDENEKEIVAALRDLPGVTVWRIRQPVDLLVGYLGINYLLEVKRPGSETRLTKDQRLFFDTWRGHRTVGTTVDEAIDAIAWQRDTKR
jgi:hypothetical protein